MDVKRKVRTLVFIHKSKTSVSLLVQTHLLSREVHKSRCKISLLQCGHILYLIVSTNFTSAVMRNFT